MKYLELCKSIKEAKKVLLWVDLFDRRDGAYIHISKSQILNMIKDFRFDDGKFKVYWSVVDSKILLIG